MIIIEKKFNDVNKLYEYLIQEKINDNIIELRFNNIINKYFWFEKNLVEIDNDTLLIDFVFPINNIPLNFFTERIRIYCNFAQYKKEFLLKILPVHYKSLHYIELTINNEKYIIGKFYLNNENKDKAFEDFTKYLTTINKYTFYNKNFHLYHQISNINIDLLKNNKLLISNTSFV